MSRRLVRLSPHAEILIGAGAFLAATWLIYDAYEGRGRKRPFLARFLP